MRRSIALVIIAGASLCLPRTFASPLAFQPAKQAGAAGSVQPREKIVEEIRADLEKTIGQLQKDDVSAQTRAAQQRILANIDELLKQQDPNPPPPSSPPKGNNSQKPNAPPPTVKPVPQTPKVDRSAAKPISQKIGAVVAKNDRVPDAKEASRFGAWNLRGRDRQEMDAYQHETFIRNYEERLRAYYQGISGSMQRNKD